MNNDKTSIGNYSNPEQQAAFDAGRAIGRTEGDDTLPAAYHQADDQ